MDTPGSGGEIGRRTGLKIPSRETGVQVRILPRACQTREDRLTPTQADQIASLINERNHLTGQHDGDSVLGEAAEYEFEERDGVVVGCVQRRRVQWYQWEIRHLSVTDAWEGRGIAYAVYQRASAHAEREGARVLQCTIREDNEKSIAFFVRQGFAKAVVFKNAESGNLVGVWLKSVSPP